MTEHVHDWGEWERLAVVTEQDGRLTSGRHVGRLRECWNCDAWEIEWAGTEGTK